MKSRSPGGARLRWDMVLVGSRGVSLVVTGTRDGENERKA